jgi:hypothetical protein
MLNSTKQYRLYKWGLFLYLVLLISFSVNATTDAGDTPVYLSAPESAWSGYIRPQVKVSIDRDPDAHRYRPQVAYNSVHQEYLVVWHNTWNTGERYVYARRLDLNGNPIGDPFALTTLLMDQVHPNVVYNADNDVYFVVWQLDASGDNSRYEIYGSIIPWNATGPGTVFPIDDGEEAYNLYYPTIAWNSTHNEYLVIWDTRSGESPYGIGYRRVAGNGIPGTGGWITTGNSPEGSDMVYNPLAGEYFLVYSRIVNDITQEVNVYGARLNRDVSFARTAFVINTSTLDQINPAVDTTQMNYIVAYQQWNSGYNHWGLDYDLLDLDGDGVAGSGTTLVPFDLKYPDLAADSNKREWLLVYQRETETGSTIWGGRYTSPDLTSIHHEDVFQIQYLYWNNRTPSVAGGGPGYLVTYTGRSSYDPNTWQHIYSTKYWQSGILMPLSMR